MCFEKSDLLALLENYDYRKKFCAVFGKTDPQIDFLDKCIACLSDEEKDVIVKTFLQKVSVRSYSTEVGLSRGSVLRKREKVLDIIVALFRAKEEENEK